MRHGQSLRRTRKVSCGQQAGCRDARHLPQMTPGYTSGHARTFNPSVTGPDAEGSRPGYVPLPGAAERGHLPWPLLLSRCRGLPETIRSAGMSRPGMIRRRTGPATSRQQRPIMVRLSSSTGTPGTVFSFLNGLITPATVPDAEVKGRTGGNPPDLPDHRPRSPCTDRRAVFPVPSLYIADGHHRAKACGQCGGSQDRGGECR